MERQITEIVEKYLEGNYLVGSENKAKMISDILVLFNVRNALPIGTKVVYEGKKMKITNNREEFEGEPAYRCDYRHDELYLRNDFESIDLGNDC